MLSPHKKYRIKRNKEVLSYIVGKLADGHGVRETFRDIGKNQKFKVSEATARDIYYRKTYKWSPYFEYDENGNILYELDCYGQKIEGTETDRYWVWKAEQKLQIETA